MRLSSYLRQDLVVHGLVAEDRAGILRALADTLRGNGLVSDGDAVFRALWEREEAHTTALGNGVAVPHAVLPFLEEGLLLVASTREAVRYGPGEKDTVDLLFALLSPPGREGEHIKLLARICRLARHPGFLETLREAETGMELYEALVREDNQHV
jgi:mannitol/fructose-specific phosphotransferase system IIA component (Ntr-type)